jgi:hypothetical protein
VTQSRDWIDIHRKELVTGLALSYGMKKFPPDVDVWFNKNMAARS